MKVSDVITLIQAGYTKAEIELFEKMEDPATPSANTEPPKPEAQPETAPEAKPEIEQPNNDKLLDAITGLTKALQVSNIRNTPQPNESAVDDVAGKADKALMEIYNL